MLRELHIKNFIIFDEVSLNFHEGFNVITGETGSGKSLLLEAVRFVLGEKFLPDRVKQNANECVVTAVFEPNDDAKVFLRSIDIEDDEIIISRKLTASGKNRFSLNGELSNAEQIKNLARFLVDMHGQHSHQQLFDSAYHRDVFDEFANTLDMRKSFAEKFDTFTTCRTKLENLKKAFEHNEQQLRLAKFEYEELSASNLHSSTEDEDIEKELSTIEAAEAIIDFAQKLEHATISSEKSLSDIAGELKTEALRQKNLPNAETIIELLDTVLAAASELGDIADNIKNIDYSPRKADKLRSRANTLADLKYKYRKTLPKLIEHFEALEQVFANCTDYPTQIAETESELKIAIENVQALGQKLSQTRMLTAAIFEKRMEDELKQLAFENPTFKLQVTQRKTTDNCFKIDGNSVSADKTGFDDVEFLFSANPGFAPDALRKVASGGELSRIALALMALSPKAGIASCTFFDEIDTGIGGMTALAVAQRLRAIAEQTQVLVITHLHPIAKAAEYHIAVAKRQTETQTFVVAKNLAAKVEREQEFARMMSMEAT